MFSYERTCSVLSGDCVSPGQATTYVVVGSAGAGLELEGLLWRIVRDIIFQLLGDEFNENIGDACILFRLNLAHIPEGVYLWDMC